MIDAVEKVFRKYGYLIEWEGKIAVNPYYLIEILKNTLEEIKMLIQNHNNLKKRELKQIRDRFIVGFIFWTGVRENEFLLTKRSDINLIAKTYNVPSLKLRRNKLQKKSIPLNHVPIEELQFWDTYFRIFKIDDDMVICDVTDRRLRQIVKEFFRDNGFPEWRKVRVHSLRHALGLWLYETTKDIRFTAQILRHTSITHTLVYTKLSLNELREKAESIRISYT